MVVINYIVKERKVGKLARFVIIADILITKVVPFPFVFPFNIILIIMPSVSDHKTNIQTIHTIFVLFVK